MSLCSKKVKLVVVCLCVWLSSFYIVHADDDLNEDEKDLDHDEQMRKLARKHGVNPDDPSDGTIMLSPPKLSPEEQGSQFMPKDHQCNACIAISYLLTQNFKAAEKHKKKGEKLRETEILTVTEKLCESEFRGYGLKNVQGLNKLSGEGLQANNEPGMVESGGRWAKRFQNMCKEIMGEYEEEMVYGFYKEMSELPLDTFICSDYCPDYDKVTPDFKDEL